MTFLQYLQQIHYILGVGSRGNTAKAGTVPTSAAGQVDELAELVQWGIKGWTNFQNSKKWGWLRLQGTLAFGAGVSSVVPATAQLPNYREWLPFVDGAGGKYVNSYLTADGASSAQQRMRYVEYDQFRGQFDRQVVATGRPMLFTIHPDMTWQVYPTPTADTAITLVLDYLCKPKIFTTADSAVNLEDWPSTGRGLPEEFQEAAVWHAVKYWAMTRNKPDMYQAATNTLKELMAPITQRYLPTARL